MPNAVFKFKFREVFRIANFLIIVLVVFACAEAGFV